ncbi:MAG: sensor hybrid histidine kinase [Verrucomicrobia bacterium]|nr:sensor hybrid histidine kinase [Verrucomicrobiota bacterium]
MDDETSIRQLIETVLVTEGFEVRVADGAQSAFAQAKSAPTPPSLMICDVIMPNTDGLSLTRQMRAQYKKLKVIFISGRLADAAWWPADLSGIRLLHKPFANSDLIQAVNEAWADSESGS